ncbi:hypothetical protein MMC29_004803 [Sticta canariensis]|nr:hypothetical protein [Sticta canariensis]
MSAIEQSANARLKHPSFGAQELCGPIEVLTNGLHKINDPGNTKGASPSVRTLSTPTSEPFSNRSLSMCHCRCAAGCAASSGLAVKADIDFDDAHGDLNDYDVLIIPGGSGIDEVLRKDFDPVQLINGFAALQQKDPSQERTLTSIGTGSLAIAQASLLRDMAATTHPDYYTKTEIVLSGGRPARRSRANQPGLLP